MEITLSEEEQIRKHNLTPRVMDRKFLEVGYIYYAVTFIN